MVYKVYQQGCEIDRTFRSEAVAICFAKTLHLDADLVQVVACERSGSYTSRQQVWPQHGPLIAT